MTPLAAIASRLRARVGLDPDTLGAGALADAVACRVAACGAADVTAYLTRLEHDAGEWQALIEAVVVPETWFFRDREPFALLARWAAAAWPGRNADEPIAVLSLPCATGEEAWSIAIVLAAAGIPAAGIRVEAFDVSERALAVARAARYGQRSLRGGCPQPAWLRYLHSDDDGTIEIADGVRSAVRFAPGNLVEAAGTLAGRQFDCVFSRNLLIYCDATARAAAVATFATLVRPGGLLVLGHAETLPPGTTAFVREGPPGAFAWRRVVAAPAILPVRVAPASVPAGARTAPQHRSRSRPGARRALSGPEAGATEDRSPQDAHACADAGRLDEAAALAEAKLEQMPADAAAHALLGVIHAAQGRDDEAAACLRRALYLDPEHEDALVHLAMILERRGDSAAAARLRSRARRRTTAAP